GAADELVLQGDEVDGLGALGERGHRVEDPAVRLAVEVVADEDLRRGVEGGVVHEHRAEHRALGLGVVGERPLLYGDLGCQCTSEAASSIVTESAVKRLRQRQRAKGVRREHPPDSAAVRQPSLVTRTRRLADTSGWSFTATSCSPSFLMGSSSWTLRLSIS